MSNKIFSTFLLALFLLAIAACNDPTPIGDDFVDDADLLGATFTDTLTVEVTLQKRTELAATTGDETLIGSLHDPVLGFAKANLYFQPATTTSRISVSGVDTEELIDEVIYDEDLKPIDTLYRYPILSEDVVQLDSLVISLNYSNSTTSIYGDTINNKIQTFNLFKMAEDFPSVEDSLNYFADEVNFMEGEYLDKYSFAYAPTKDIIIQDEVLVDADSTRIDTTLLSPQTRLRLPDSLGEDFLTELANFTGVFNSDTTFVEYFKGFYLESLESNTATALIDLPNSYMRMYYTAIDNEYDSLGVFIGATETQQALDFRMYDLVSKTTTDANGNSTSEDINQRFFARQYTHDYTGTPIETILNSADKKITDLGYLQGMGGVEAVVTIPNIDKLGDIIVNKAELVITNYEDNVNNLDSIYTLPTNLFVQITETEEFTADANNFLNNIFTAEVDSITSEIINTCNLYQTYSTQVVVNDTDENGKSFTITPLGGRENPGRVIFQGPENENRPIKLNLYYTPVE